MFRICKNRACRSDKERAFLATGALETHGERMIGRVEAEARANPDFRRLLTGVWQHGMPDEVWTQVLVASAVRRRTSARSLAQERPKPSGKLKLYRHASAKDCGHAPHPPRRCLGRHAT